MEQEKEYYAFISYKREDEKWAKWLQHKLEHYRFPTNLNGRTDLPKNIRPTFRDMTDLTPGVLAEEIDAALHNSQWLIVVCSPRSAKSPWVCKEAQTFIDLGRADHIIPFVIEGNPFSNDPDTECYPEALLNLTGSKELLAANINEMGRDAAVIKVVARMFGLKFDTLWRRHEREQRRKRIWGVFFALIVICISLLLVFVFRSQKKNLQLSQSRFVAEKAEQLVDEGDSYLAQLLLLEVLPDGSFDDRPYSVEAELALRKALKKNSRKLPFSDIAYFNIQFSPDDKYVIGMTQDDTLYVWSSDNGQLIKKFHLSNYPHKDHDVYDRDVFFLNDTQIFFVDSVAHVWDIHTGENVTDMNAKSAYAKVKRHGYKSYRIDNNKVDAIWDKNNDGTEFIKQLKDHSLVIQNNSGKIMEKIPVSNPLFATFTNDQDEILVIQDGHIVNWSRSEHRVVSDFEFNSKDFPARFWEYNHINFPEEEQYDYMYFSQDMRRVVIHVFVDSYSLSAEYWVSFNLKEPSNEIIISFSPIEFSSDGSLCLRSVSNYFYDAPDYCLYDFAEVRNSCSQTKNTFFNQNAWMWEWKGHRQGQYVFTHEDATLYVDGNSFSVVKTDIEEVCMDFSSDQRYYFTKDREGHMRIYKNSKFQKSLSLSGIERIKKVDVSSDGNKLFVWSDTVEDVVDDDGFIVDDRRMSVYRLWDIRGENTVLLFESTCQKYNDVGYVLTPNGKYIISTSGDVLDVTSKNKQRLQAVNCTTGLYYSNIRCSQDSKTVAIWSGEEVALWDIGSKQLLWKVVLTNSYEQIFDLTFNPNGNDLLVTYRYGAYVLDTKKGETIERIETIGECYRAFYSVHNNQIVLITREGCYTFPHPTLKEIISKAKNNLKGRKLTKEEREKYFLQ